MKQNILKEIFLGEFGAGILLIIIQLIIGVHIKKNIPYTLGCNFIALIGIACIIDGIRRIKGDKYEQNEELQEVKKINFNSKAIIVKKKKIKILFTIIFIFILILISLILFQNHIQSKKETISTCFKEKEKYLKSMLERECKNTYDSVAEQIINGTYGHCMYEKEKLYEYITNYTKQNKECIK